MKAVSHLNHVLLTSVRADLCLREQRLRGEGMLSGPPLPSQPSVCFIYLHLVRVN